MKLTTEHTEMALRIQGKELIDSQSQGALRRGSGRHLGFSEAQGDTLAYLEAQGDTLAFLGVQGDTLVFLSVKGGELYSQNTRWSLVKISVDSA